MLEVSGQRGSHVQRFGYLSGPCVFHVFGFRHLALLEWGSIHLLVAVIPAVGY